MDPPAAESWMDNLGIIIPAICIIAIAGDTARVISGNPGVGLVAAGAIMVLFSFAFSFGKRDTANPKRLIWIALFVSTIVLAFVIFTRLSYLENMGVPISPTLVHPYFYGMAIFIIFFHLIRNFLFRCQLTGEEIREPHEEYTTISQPFDYAFRLCRRSVQLLTDFEIRDSECENDYGTIHAESHNHFVTVTFTLGKVGNGQTRIKVQSIANPPANYHRNLRPTTLTWDNKRIVTRLIRSIQECAAAEKELPEYTVAPAVCGVPEGSVVETGNAVFRLQSPWIKAGIVLLILGVILDLVMIKGFIEGTVDITTKYHRPGTHYEYFLVPLMPGGLAVFMGFKGQPAPTLSATGNGTGVLVGKGPFYKNPKIAALLSVVVPGMGQAYNGQSALGMLVAFGAGIGLLFALVPGIRIWLFCIYYAYTSAEQINCEKIPFAPVEWGTVVAILGIFIPCFIVAGAFFLAFGPLVVLGMTPEKICTVVHCG